MNAGTLRDIISVEEPVETRDGFGGQQTGWRTVWRGKANVGPTGGTRKEINSETVHTATRKVKVRWKPAFSVRMRLVIDGQKYRILAMDRNRADMSATFTVELINE